MDCPVHYEPLFPSEYDKKIGYCKRCKAWYEFPNGDKKEE